MSLNPGKYQFFTRNKRMQLVLDSLPLIASSRANVLIIGESGTGKEVLAKRIHAMGPRARKDLISLNCAAIPESLLESELFGHKKGAFTGATNDHTGLFEMANGSTIFLDEIGDMPLVLQAKLLRVLQEKKIRTVGGGPEKSVDFRLIAATHRDLRKEIELGRFREDLYYRLNVMPVFIPPLRQRPEDIYDFIQKFSHDVAIRHGLQIVSFSPEAINNLVRRPWPGNIRELENLVEYMTVIFQDKRVIEITDLPEVLTNFGDERAFSWPEKFSGGLPTVDDLIDEYIKYILKLVGYHQGEAARILGLSRRTLYRKLKEQGDKLYENEGVTTPDPQLLSKKNNKVSG